jgi:hydroxypyruvate isomerase
MPDFAANISMLYAEHPFPERFAAAAADGFKAVEFTFGYAWPKEELAARLVDAGVRCVLLNAPLGDFDAGERGFACLPGREDDFRRSIDLALAYALAMDAPRIHVMAGVKPLDIEPERARDVYLDNMEWAARHLAAHGRDVMIEPINTRDMPGYFLNYQAQAHEIVIEAAQPNLKVQMDLYHCQIMEGDLATKVRQYLPTGRVGHLQFAGVPDRNEPDVGELQYGYLFDLIDDIAAQCGWDGWVGAEYRPRLGARPGATAAGLGWWQARRR